MLIAERPPGKHLSGRWEFPGGKIDAGETEQEALERELAEELGIGFGAGQPLMHVAHDYDDRLVEISLWLVSGFSGEPRGLDGQALKWVFPDRLQDEDMLAADVPFIAALQRLYNDRLT